MNEDRPVHLASAMVAFRQGLANFAPFTRAGMFQSTMDNKRVLLFAFGILLLGLLANKIRTGKCGSISGLRIKRSEKPGSFWTIMVLDFGIAVAVLSYSLLAKHIP